MKERTCWRGVLQCTTAWVRARDGGGTTVRGNSSCHAVNARAHDALDQLGVETVGVKHLRAVLIARDENESRHWAEYDARRSEDDGVRRERDDVLIGVAVLEGRVDGLCHELARSGGVRDRQDGWDGH